ncbi:MAG: hypothetical protein MJ078_05670, partial [Clostridia bacterium]|nr:hypothetical protein [Clostridia bacterium]
YAIRSFCSVSGKRVVGSRQNTIELSMICRCLLAVQERVATEGQEQMKKYWQEHSDIAFPYTLSSAFAIENEEKYSVAVFRHKKHSGGFSFIGGDPLTLLPYMMFAGEGGTSYVLDKSAQMELAAAVKQIQKDGYHVVAYAQTNSLFTPELPVSAAHDLKLLGFFILSPLPDREIGETLRKLKSEKKKVLFLHGGDDPSWMTEGIPELADIPVADVQKENGKDTLIAFAEDGDTPFCVGVHLSGAEQGQVSRALQSVGRKVSAFGNGFFDHRMTCSSSSSAAPLPENSEEAASIVYETADAHVGGTLKSAIGAPYLAEDILASQGALSVCLGISALLRTLAVLVGFLFPAVFLPIEYIALWGGVADLLLFFAIGGMRLSLSMFRKKNPSCERGRVEAFLIGGGLSAASLAVMTVTESLKGASLFSPLVFGTLAAAFLLCVILFRFAPVKVNRFSLLFPVTAAAAFLTVGWMTAGNDFFRVVSSGELYCKALVPTLVFLLVSTVLTPVFVRKGSDK